MLWQRLCISDAFTSEEHFLQLMTKTHVVSIWCSGMRRYFTMSLRPWYTSDKMRRSEQLLHLLNGGPQDYYPPAFRRWQQRWRQRIRGHTHRIKTKTSWRILWTGVSAATVTSFPCLFCTVMIDRLVAEGTNHLSIKLFLNNWISKRTTTQTWRTATLTSLIHNAFDKSSVWQVSDASLHWCINMQTGDSSDTTITHTHWVSARTVL